MEAMERRYLTVAAGIQSAPRQHYLDDVRKFMLSSSGLIITEGFQFGSIPLFTTTDPVFVVSHSYKYHTRMTKLV